MEFETWDVDLASGEAKHACGCVIRVEGDPRNPTSVDPSQFPKDLSFVDQARMLRCGVEALAKAAESEGYVAPIPAERTDVRRKSRTARELEQKAKAFANNPDKPKRAVLSLKRPKEKVTE